MTIEHKHGSTTIPAKPQRIAPVVAPPAQYKDYGIPWQVRTETVGRALGKADEAKSLVAGVEARFADERAKHPEFAEATGLALTPYEGFFVYGRDDPRTRTLTSADGDLAAQVLPFVVVGAVLAVAAAPALNSLALGEDVAASLGRRLGLVRFQSVVAVMLLTGGAVAVIGPVVFVGLVVPHLARILTQSAGIGPDHRWLMPLSAALAPCLLLAADIVGRLVAKPLEIQAGVLVAFVGGPVFLALVRRRRLAEL